MSNDKVFVQDSLKIKKTDTSFSNKVGDEASTLKLSLDVDTEAFVVDKNQLTDMAKEILKDRVPEGFVLRSEQIDVEFEFTKEEDSKYLFDVRITANLLPEINPEDIAEKITGKYPAVAENFLTQSIPGFASAEIRIKPALPGKLKTLPRVRKNIEVEVSAQR